MEMEVSIQASFMKTSLMEKDTFSSSTRTVTKATSEKEKEKDREPTILVKAQSIKVSGVMITRSKAI